jgi:hypothetical protein
MERPKIGTIVAMILCSLLAAEAPADLTPVGARKPSPDLALRALPSEFPT